RIEADRVIVATGEFTGPGNFISLLSDQGFRDAFMVTFIITVGTTLLQNVFGILFAVWMNKKNRLNNVCRTVLFIPAILSSVVVSFIWSYMTQGNGGIINTVMGFFHLGPFDFFKNPLITTLTVTFTISWAALGFYITVYTAALKTIPTELYEAAAIDGAGKMNSFFRITLPLLTPGLTIGIMFSLISGLRQYDFVKIMTPQTIETVAVNAVSRMTEYNMFGYSAAIVLVLFLFILVVSILQRFALRKLEVDY
ncbi:MAG TPA: sugar ABC transporter permease, partial [Candidatus Mediterraneibacter merdipullorum]|nr:sugar ABC transporter permease [Candidatus Mediterraneibacter merdipullorum]